VWHIHTFICVTWLAHNVWQCVTFTWPTHMCDRTRSYMWQDALLCDMTLRMWHGALHRCWTHTHTHTHTRLHTYTHTHTSTHTHTHRRCTARRPCALLTNPNWKRTITTRCCSQSHWLLARTPLRPSLQLVHLLQQLLQDARSRFLERGVWWKRLGLCSMMWAEGVWC